jgi:hypothetical protein
LLPERAVQTLEEAERKLRQMLSYSNIIHNRFRHGEIKRLIDQFAKAAGDDSAVAELLIANLDAGFGVMEDVGDYEEMADHLYSTMNRLDKCLSNVVPESLNPLVEKLKNLAETWHDQFGYGLSDELDGFAEEWKRRAVEKRH